MKYIGGMPVKDRRITDEDSFNFFNMLPKIDEIGGNFAQDFKILMEFEKNKSVAYMQRLPLNHGIKKEEREYAAELASYTKHLVNHLFGPISDEEKQYIDLSSAAIETGLHGKQRLIARDASKKNFLFNVAEKVITDNLQSLVNIIPRISPWSSCTKLPEFPG